jgi:hypothetical protein
MFYKFRVKLIRWLSSFDSNGIVCREEKVAQIKSSNDLRAKGIYFKVYNASGGTVIETTPMNDDHDDYDRNRVSLYVIHESQDLATELSHIITLTSLRN